MARRTFTNIVLALGLLCTIAASTAVKAQQVTFAISPTQVAPAVGDTLKLNVVVQNFTSIVSFQYAIEWDGALLSYIAVDSLSMPDQSNFLPNPFGGNTVLAGWNASGAAKSVPNGQRIFRLRLKVLAASSNYWVKFSNANLDIEVIQDPGLRSVTPVFVNLGTPPGASTIPVGGKITGRSTLTGQKVCVPVTTSDFTNVVSTQWVNKWNSAVLRFDSVSTLNNTLGLRTANFGTSQASSGRLAFSWNAPSGSVSVANNDTLYKVCYTAVGANGTSSVVTFDSAEIYRRSAVGDSRVALNGVNGTVTVGSVVVPPTSGLVFAASNHNINAGDSVCIKIKTGAFTDIAVMQWSMHWDSTKMTLIGASSAAGLGIAPWTSTTSQGDFNNLINGNPSGSLRFLWVSPTGNGYTLADSTVLIELCFKYIGAGNTNSTFRFDGVPLKIQVKDGNLVNIPPIFRSGNVSATVSIQPTTFTGVAQNVNCPGGNTGTITLTPSGGSGTYTYSWTGPNGFTATSKDLVTRTAGKYYVTVTSNATSKVDSFTIIEPAAFATSTVLTHINCKGGTAGTITLTGSGGTAPYTYSWTGPNGFAATTKDLTALAAGIYKLTITDTKLCSVSRADTITEPAAALTVSTVSTNVNCKSGRDGTITTTVLGGTTPYSYSWIGNNGTIANTKDLTALTTGVYNLTVTDAKSCSANSVQTLTEPDSIKIGTAVIVGTRCSQPKGAITISSVVGGTGAYSYSWSGPSNFTATTRDLTNLAPGQYTLTAKDAKTCTSAATAFTVVDTAANITNSVPAVTNVTCFGGSNGAISLTALGAGPLTYAWTGPNNFTASTSSISNLKMGNYTLVINDAGCNKTIAASVNEPTAITTSAQSVNIKCKGDLSGSIALNATGGTAPLTITWTGTGGFTGTGQSIGSLKAGTYTASITDANSCTNSPAAITITEPTDSLKITNAAITNIACNGGNNGIITLTVAGGTPQYTYTWTGVGGFTSNQKDISSLKAGDYRVTATDANNCRAEKLYTLIDPQAVVVTAGTTDASGTPNGTISLNIAGGRPPFKFLWTGQGVSPTAQNQTGLCPGTYSVAVQDASDCSVSKSITVGGSCSTPMRIVGTPTITASGCVGQNLGQISINWEGGVAPYVVTWVQIINGIPNSVATETVQARSSTLTNRQTGTYAIKIADAVGQTLALPPMVITGSVTPLTATATISDETCRGSDGSITLTVRDAASPVTFSWNTGATSQDIFNLTARATPYKVTITDANRCIKEMGDMYVKRTPCPLVITSAKVNPTCFGGNNGSITIDIANGEPTYTVTSPTGQVIILPNANSRTNSYVLRDLVAGTYVVTITDAASQTQTVTHVLASPTQITVDRRVTGDQGSCNGSIILTVNGGLGNYTYQWNTGATSRDLFNLCCNDGRRYSVIVKDGNNCQVSTTNDTISCNIALLTLDSSKTRSPLCQSDSTNSRIDVFVHGGVLPHFYEWRNQIGATVGSNSPILTNQPPGRYYLTVSDSRSPNSQRVTFETVLKVSSTLAFGPINVSVCATDNIASDGVVTINLISGAAPYSIRWPDASTSLAQTNTATNSALKAGKGEITVTDLQGCVIKTDVTICSKACATIRTNTIHYTPKDTFNIQCAKNCDGGATVLSLSADYKLPIRAYQWSSGEVGSTAFKLCPNINTVTVTDADGKTCVSRINMKAPALFKDTVWVDDKTRTLESVPTGGVQPYTYLWTTDNRDTTRKVTVNRTGVYYVVVQDFFNCVASGEGRIVLDATCLDGSIILTPNDDGRNENFRFKSCDFKKVRLEVYNRFGQLVYSSNDYKENWYGNKEDGPTGEPLPEGVYMYVLSATDVAGKQQLGKGTVNIIRN